MKNVSRPMMFVLIGLVVLLALVPLGAGDFYVILVTKIMALCIFAMSLDLLLGYTGMVSFGHAAYFGVAAYTAAMLAPPYDSANLLVTLPAAIGASALAALAVGALCVRTGGIYFIMVTLAFAQMGYFVFHDIRFFGGSDGKLLFAKPDIVLGGKVLISLGTKISYYYFVLFMLVAAFFLLLMIVRSPFGRVIQGIKANEHRMKALGYNTYWYKLASFVIGGAFAGLAGYLVAYQAEFVSPSLLSWRESGHVLMMVILGGQGTLYGAAFGAIALVLFEQLFESLTSRWMLLMGIFIVAVVLFLPKGIGGLLAGLIEKGKRQDG